MAKAVSSNPDSFAQGGLKDDFNGTILDVLVGPWDYNGSTQPVLAAEVIIKDDDEEEPFSQHYSMGDLENFQPSKDGENAVDFEKYGIYNEDGTPTWNPEDMKGHYVVAVGKKDALSTSSNWAFFTKQLVDAGFVSKFKGTFGSDFAWAKGVYGHFNRIPQPKRSGMVQQAPRVGKDGKPKNNDVLVVTEIKEIRDLGKSAAPVVGAKAKVNPAKPATPAPAAAPAATPAPAAASGDLDAKLNALVVTALGDEPINKTKLPPLALKGLAAADKSKGVKRIVDTEFLEAGGDGAWIYDAEAGLLYKA